MYRNGDVPRALVRDMYTKSWSAFDRLVAIVPPGGSIGYVIVWIFYRHSLTRVIFIALTISCLVSGIFKETASHIRTSKEFSALKLA